MTRVVLALGGNALWRRGEDRCPEVRDRTLATAAAAVAAIATDHEVVVVHGNGPHVGDLALREEAVAREGERAVEPLDVLGAESEGLIGYLLERELRSRLPGRPIASLLTLVEVGPDDPAMRAPTKFIGPAYPRERAERLAEERGWAIARDGEGWRRVVPSPRPRRILHEGTVGLLVGSGHVVICAGGGGVPVTIDEGGHLRGLEGVVDKDRSACLLAAAIAADVLLLLTDTDHLYRDWPAAKEPIERIDPAELRRLPLPEGSMGPKAEAAADFVDATGGRAAIGALGDAIRVLDGAAGTQVTRGS